MLDYDLNIDPAPDFSTSGTDYFGNPVTMFSISQPHRELTISSRCLLDLAPSSAPQLQISPPREQVRERAFKDDF